MSSAAGCGRLLWCWMWCAALDCARYLAVNNGVRRQISDSGAIRSVAVPNVKIARGSVAFWHNAPVRTSCGEARPGFDPGGTGSCQENASIKIERPVPIPSERKRPSRLGAPKFTSRWNAAAASRPPWPRPCRRSCRCANARRSSGRRRAVDRYRCDPRKELPLAGLAADPHFRRIVPAVFHALPYNQSPLPRPANAGLKFAAKSIPPLTG